MKMYSAGSGRYWTDRNREDRKMFSLFQRKWASFSVGAEPFFPLPGDKKRLLGSII